jgi:photosystem II stability/assembly factor-like uncharacterized protein
MWRELSCLGIGIVLACGAASQTPVGAWHLLPNSPVAANRLDDGSFVSPDTGFVITSTLAFNGIYATEDGGATWEQRASLPIGPRSVGFATDSIGWVGSLFGPTNQQLFETRDGGRTFTNIADRIQGGPMLGVCGISVVNPSVVYGTGWCCGGFGSGVMKTVDGGQTWQVTRLDSTAEFLIDIHFFDELRGLAVGATPSNNALVLGTEDGGAIWTVRHVSADSSEWGWKIHFPTPDTGYVAIEHIRFQDPDGKVLRTIDGGQTWTDVTIPNGGRLQGVGFAQPGVGWTSGRGIVSETRDGGQTWAPYVGPLDGAVNRFRFLSDTLGYAFGGRVYKYTIGGGTASEPGPTEDPLLVTVYPNPSSDRVSFLFDLSETAEADLSIYDVQGRRVAGVARRTLSAGSHTITWVDGSDGSPRLPAGTYYYRVSVGAVSDSGPFIWVPR